MLSIIGALWGSKPTRWAASALLMIGAYKGWEYRQRSIGGQAVIAKSEKAGKVNRAKAAKSHDAAQRPGAAERLLKSDCRDCR